MGRSDSVLILGSGLDALVCATYVARAGRRVTIVEPSETVGGCAVTDEIAPGFRVSATFQSAETLDPSLVDDLSLRRHGLDLLEPEGFSVASAEGEPWVLPADDAARREAIAARSSSDARACDDLDALLAQLMRGLGPLLADPLPALEVDGMGDIFALLRPALRLRRLGAQDLAELMRLLPMPIHDVVEERLMDEGLRAAVAGSALQGSWLGPRSPGSMLNFLLHRSGIERRALPFPRFVRGGTGALIGALEQAARAAGVIFRLASPVREIRTYHGEVNGLLLADGEEIPTHAVISSLDPRRTLTDLLEPLSLTPEDAWRAQGIRCRGTVALVHYALEDLPAFRGLDDPAALRGRLQVGETLDELEQAFDDVKYGRLPRRPTLNVTIPSLTDPQLAPAGQHVMSVWVQFPPYALRERSWEEARDDLGEVVDATLDSVAPGFTGRVVTRRVLTPADLETRFGMSGGCLYHVEPALDQALYLRPMPGCGRQDTPVRGLWLTGPGTHGGAALSGQPGRNTARRFLAADR